MIQLFLSFLPDLIWEDSDKLRLSFFPFQQDGSVNYWASNLVKVSLRIFFYKSEWGKAHGAWQYQVSVSDYSLSLALSFHFHFFIISPLYFKLFFF